MTIWEEDVEQKVKAPSISDDTNITNGDTVSLVLDGKTLAWFRDPEGKPSAFGGQTVAVDIAILKSCVKVYILKSR